jgi:hypothetical protein
MPQFEQNDIVKLVKNTAYAVVGAGVLAAEQLDKCREDLVERFSTPAADLVSKARQLGVDARKIAVDGRQQLRSFVLRDAA